MKIGIFIEPKHENLKIIRIWKKIIKKNFKEQKYLNHPPHSTIAVFNFKKKIDINDLKISLKKIRIKKSIYIKILKSSIFYNDPITKGDTLHFLIKKNKELIILQKKILKEFTKYNKFIKKNEKLRDKKFNLNLKKFGYPFVGNEWLPHFTIASINAKFSTKNLILNKFLKQKITKKLFKVDNFSVWQITGEKHKKIFKISLL